MGWLQNAIRLLLPSESGFFELVIEAANAAKQSAELFAELAHAPSDTARIALVERIKDAEHEADRALHEMGDALSRTFVTPLDREDLYALTSALETITDFVSSTANQILVHRMQTLPLGTEDLATVLVKATALLHEAVGGLARGGAHDQIRAACHKVQVLEHEADVIFRTRVGDLFSHEKDPIALIKHKEFLEGLEDATDRCAWAARAIESTVLKHG